MVAFDVDGLPFIRMETNILSAQAWLEKVVGTEIIQGEAFNFHFCPNGGHTWITLNRDGIWYRTVIYNVYTLEEIPNDIV
jgi:hypothetical protein